MDFATWVTRRAIVSLHPEICCSLFFFFVLRNRQIRSLVSPISPTTQPDARLDYPVDLREADRHLGMLLRGSRPLGEADVGSAISSLIIAADRGDKPAAEALFAALYSELHRLAKRELARRGLQASLGATTLLHEAYLDMAGRDGPSFPDRARFMGYAARVMRGLIIDHARERHAQKHGGLFEIASLDTTAMANAVDHRELVGISET